MIRMMMMSIALSMLAIAHAGCATVGAVVPLPADYSELPVDTVRDVAMQIETAVANGEREPAINVPGAVVVTPEITAGIRERAIRAPLVHGLLQSGFAYEQHGGLIAIRRSGDYKRATTSTDRDRNAQVVQSENQARWILYEGLLKANAWAPRSRTALQEIFAEERAKVLPSGSHYETGDGAQVQVP